MSNSKRVFLLFLIFTFILGLYVTMHWNVHINVSTNVSTNEPMENKDDNSCPNLLIQKGNTLLLYNKNKPEDKNNPIPFFNLDEYINYLEIKCYSTGRFEPI